MICIAIDMLGICINSTVSPFQVKEIIDRRTKKISGKLRLEYLIQWKGFGRSADTWEPLENLKSCQALVRKYELQHNKNLAMKKTSDTKILKNAINHKPSNNCKKLSLDKQSKPSVTVKKKVANGSTVDADSDDGFRYSLVTKPSSKTKKKQEAKPVKKVSKGVSKNSDNQTNPKIPLTIIQTKDANFITNKKKGLKRLKLLDSMKKNEVKPGKII